MKRLGGKRKERTIESYFKKAEKTIDQKNHSGDRKKIKDTAKSLENAESTATRESVPKGRALQERTNVDMSKDEASKEDTMIPTSLSKKPLAPTTILTSSRTKPTNIAYQLISRTLHGRNAKVATPQMQWQTTTWIGLGSRSEFDNVPWTVNRFAWDSLGVLLAAYCNDGMIRIFDWDVVLAADQKGRNCWIRDQHGFSAVDPLLIFPVGGTKCAFLQWNAFQQDELAVGLVGSSEVHIYDIAVILTRVDRLGSRARINPKYRLRTQVSIDVHSSFLLMGKGTHALLTLHEDISCWKLASGKASMKWKFKWQRTTAVSALASDLIILGSSTGNMAIINWKRLQRTAFSVTPSPTMVHHWVSFKGIASPPPSAMGIRHLSVSMAEADAREITSASGLISLSWVTLCGWILSADIDIVARRNDVARVLHSTKEVKCVSAKGEQVKPPKRSWSLPLESVHAASTDAAIVCERVSPVVQILPNLDQRVLDTKARFVRPDDKKVLIWMSKRDLKLTPIRLPRTNGRALALALHPSNEWIVWGAESGGIQVMNARRGVAPRTGRGST